MAQKDMYKGQELSPDYILQVAIDDTETVITLNTLVGLVPPPGLLVLGADTATPEVVRYTLVPAINQVPVERGVEGVAKAWGAGTVVRNQLTALGYNNIIDNITDNATEVSNNATDLTDATKITTGLINGNRLPNPSDTVLGGVKVRDKGAGTLLITSDGND